MTIKAEQKQYMIVAVITLLLGGGGSVGAGKLFNDKYVTRTEMRDYVENNAPYVRDRKLFTEKLKKLDRFEQMEATLVNIAVDICKLKSIKDPAAEANCEQIRYNYYRQ